jgi:hypothetical protein
MCTTHADMVNPALLAFMVVTVIMATIRRVS